LTKTTQIQGSFVRDILHLGSGTAISQIIIILASPVLTRLYAPEAFGVTALFVALATVFSTMSGLRYELAILLPEDDSDGFDLLILHVFLTMLIGAIIGSIFLLGRDFIADWLNSPSLASFMFFFAAAIIILGLINGISYWNIRCKRYNLLASTKVLNSSVTIGIQLIAGFLGFFSPGYLITGSIAGKAAEDFVQGLRSFRDAHFFRISGCLARLRSLSLRYQKFAIYNTPSALINSLSWYIPPLLLAAFFSTTIVGFYAVGERVVRAPMNFIGRAISQVFFQRGAEAFRRGELGRLFINTLQMLTRIGLLPALTLSIIGKELFIIILGQKWAEAGVYVQILSFWSFFWFITSPISTILSIAEKQEKALVFDTINIITRVFSLIIGGVFHNPRLALFIFALSGIITYVWLLFWTGEISGVKWQMTLIKIFKSDTPLTLLALLPIILAKLMNFHALIIIIIAVLIHLVFYAFLFKKHKGIVLKRA
jgi:lipopolysaccharide exporter